MEADFSGYATKSDLLCADGLTIKSGAFKHQDKVKVPLVWSHTYDGPANVLGHAILEDRPDGTYTRAFFNETEAGQNAKILVQHGDINAMSIHANRLKKRGKDVVHGNIQEVSLVLAGANPGALIDSVNLSHSDGTSEVLEDEGVIFTNETFDHVDRPDEESTEQASTDETQESSDTENSDSENQTEETEDEQSSEAISHSEEQTVTDTATTNNDQKSEETVQDVLDTFSEKQRTALNYVVGAVVEQLEDGDDDDDNDSASHSNQGDNHMRSNVFGTQTEETIDDVLSHDDIRTIMSDAQADGSLKDAFLSHASVQDYGFDKIDTLFPDAKSVTGLEIIGRRQEWVKSVIDGARHSPFARIKSMAADLTAEEARAKGYVKASMKKEQIVKLLKRVTTPTTIYKKQKLDRDDVVDITDLDIVAWIKAEMRVMLDEEIAGAILIGDGREVDHDDKIDEDHIRPIATDDDMYAYKLNLAQYGNPTQLIEGIIRSRRHFKGTGTPTLYTTDEHLTDMLLDKDKMGRGLYDSEAALAAKLRVSKIVPVEIFDRVPNVIGIVVNIADYTIGADRGGQVSMFDDFDIDFNQHKYLIETRISGALTKPHSAIVITKSTSNTVVPQEPAFDAVAGVITIPSQTGVVYTIDDEVVTAGDVPIEETTEVESRPASGYSFAAGVERSWLYTPTGGM